MPSGLPEIPMQTLVIVNNLTNDVVNPDYPTQVNIGRPESERLFGVDRTSGPIPVFLRTVKEAIGRGSNIRVISSYDAHGDDASGKLAVYGQYNMIGTPGAEIYAPVRDLLNQPGAITIPVSGMSIPIRDIQTVVRRLTTVDCLDSAEDALLRNIRWVVLGAHSDLRIIDTADTLANTLGFPHVVVSPHLSASADPDAHKEAFQRRLPGKLIGISSYMRELCEFAGIELAPYEVVGWQEACEILPEDFAENLQPAQRRILDTMFMGMDSIEVKVLGGGYSGSMLLIVTPKRNGSIMEPSVVKIDRHEKMRAELDGYHLVKGLLSKRVPTFEPSVANDTFTGVRMELAALVGKPTTFQSKFEEVSLSRFQGPATQHVDVAISVGKTDLVNKLSGVLKVLNQKLYDNTRRQQTLNPVSRLKLDDPRQASWLRANIEQVVEGGSEGDTVTLCEGVEIPNPVAGFEKITSSKEEITCDTCAVHGDLNLANVIFDGGDNFWLIDWTHAGQNLMETDYAKIENDIKFVMSKEFTENDLPNLAKFEKYILGNFDLPQLNMLPAEMSFISADLRFAKMYVLLQKMRMYYLALKRKSGNDSDAISERLYKMALLRCSTHTLSFDKKRGRGECELPALKYALLSTSMLVSDLNRDSQD